MEENYKLAKWLNNEMTDMELQEFQSEPDYHLYEKIKKYSSELETPSFDSQIMLNNVLSAKKEDKKTGGQINRKSAFEKLKHITQFHIHSVIKFSPRKELLHPKFHSITTQFVPNN